ncbi:MAG: hypothetical protein RID07_09835 [Lacipirellulaceae bacterium]
MLVANPTYYRIDKAVRALPKLTWPLRQTKYTKIIASSDRAYVWRSGPQFGIIARGTIASGIVPMTLPKEEEPFVRDQTKFPKNVEETGIWFEIEDFLPQCLTFDVMRANSPELDRLEVVRLKNQTLSRVAPELVSTIDTLYSKANV